MPCSHLLVLQAVDPLSEHFPFIGIFDAVEPVVQFKFCRRFTAMMEEDHAARTHRIEKNADGHQQDHPHEDAPFVHLQIVAIDLSV